VRRDEAEAQAREAEEERKQQESHADRRLCLLRGQAEEAAPGVRLVTEHKAPSRDHDHRRKRRRLAGEDDTDRDIRLAREDALLPEHGNEICDGQHTLVDRDGHVDLMTEQHDRSRQMNDSARSKVVDKVHPGDALNGVRLVDAVSRYDGANQPWYTSTRSGLVHQEAVSKDVWGKEDPRRRAREERRLDASDPLAAIKKGVKQLRQAEQSREEWKRQREKDLNEVEELAKRERRRRRRRYKADENSLEDLKLDAGHPTSMVDSSLDRHRSTEHTHRHRSHRHRHHSPSGSPERRHRHAHHRHNY